MPLRLANPLPLVALLFAACSSPDTSDGSTDVTADVTTDTIAVDVMPADGGGICCPLTASPGCSAQGYFGGWASTSGECRMQSVFDGCPTRLSVDSHGCSMIETPGTCPMQCGAVQRDTGNASDATDDTSDSATHD